MYGFVVRRRRQHRRAARRRADRRARLALDLPRQPADRRRRVRAVPAAAAAPRSGAGAQQQLDVAGAVTVTASLMLAVYAVVNGNEAGWTSAQTLGLLGARGGAARRLPRHRVARRAPLMPLALFRLRNVADRQHRRRAVGRGDVRLVLHLRALPAARCWATARCRSGLAFLPANLIMAAFSLGLSAKLVMRFGIRAPLRRAAARRGRASRCSRARRSTAASSSMSSRRWCCSASAPASRSTRCCWRP